MIFAVPLVIPVTIPVLPTVATVVPDDDHVPPLTDAVKETEPAGHIVVVPETEPASGNAVTVITAVTLEPEIV
jgi:hypothetical protein